MSACHKYPCALFFPYPLPFMFIYHKAEWCCFWWWWGLWTCPLPSVGSAPAEYGCPFQDVKTDRRFYSPVSVREIACHNSTHVLLCLSLRPTIGANKPSCDIKTDTKACSMADTFILKIKTRKTRLSININKYAKKQIRSNVIQHLADFHNV